MSQQLWPSPLPPPAATSAAAKTTACERRLMQQHVEAVLVSEGRWPGTHIPNLLLAVKARLEPYWQIQAATTENPASSAGPVPQPLSRLCLNRIRSAVGVKRLAATAAARTSGSPSAAGKKRLHEELRLPARMEDYLTLTRLPETMNPVPCCSPQKTMTMISSMPKKRMMTMMLMKNQKTDDVTTKEQQLGPASDAVLGSRKMTGHCDCPLEDPLSLRIRELLESSTKSV
jgi:hypothetical protein